MIYKKHLLTVTLVFLLTFSLIFLVEASSLVWTSTYGGTEIDAPRSLVTTIDGGYALVGDTSSFGAGSEDFWLVKADADGNMQWNNTYGGEGQDSAHSLINTSDGGYAIAGDTESFSGSSEFDFWLVKTDSNGNLEWNQTYGGPGIQMARSLVATSDGGYAIAGFTYTKPYWWGWYLMDVRSGWRDFYTQQANTLLSSPYVDGIFGDDVLNEIRWTITAGVFSDAVTNTVLTTSDFPSSYLDNWKNDMVDFLNHVKDNLNPNKKFIINSEERTTNVYLVDTNVDGKMDEGFAEATTQEMLLQSLDGMVRDSATGKIFIAENTAGWEYAESSRSAKYCYAATLLAINGDNCYFGYNFGEYYGYDQGANYLPTLAPNLGSPKGSYYKNQSVYQRDFTNGKVLLNPSDSIYSVDLGGNYQLLNGTIVTSITLEPWSGEVLLSVTAPHSELNLKNAIIIYGTRTLTLAQQEDVANNFDLLITGTDMTQATLAGIKALNPNILIFVYLDAIAVHDDSSTLWSTINAHEDWFMHDNAGNRVINHYATNFLKDTDLWMIKTDELGNVEWSYEYGNININEKGNSLIATSDGGYAIAGEKTSDNGQTDFWLVKIDAYGNMEWNQTYGGVWDDLAYCVVETYDEGYAISGATLAYNGAEADILLVKTDSNGKFEWNQTYGGIDEDWAFSLVAASDGGYAIVGYTWSFGAGKNDIWLIKTEANGNVEWDQTYGGIGMESAFSMVPTSDGGYAIAGVTDFGATDLFDVGIYDFWLLKTDEYGLIPEFSVLPPLLTLLVTVMAVAVIYRRRLARYQSRTD